MSDLRARELERRWRETGALEDRVAWLRQRMRGGELPLERLALAAAVGDAASGEVLGWPARPDPARLGRVLSELGPARCALIAVAATRAVLDRCPAMLTPDPEPPSGLTERVQRLWRAPDLLPSHAARSLLQEVEAWSRSGEPPRPSQVRAAMDALRVGHRALCPGECGPLRCLETLARIVLWPEGMERDLTPGPDLARAAGEAAVDAVRAAQWTLRDDPCGAERIAELALSRAEGSPA